MKGVSSAAPSEGDTASVPPYGGAWEYRRGANATLATIPVIVSDAVTRVPVEAGTPAKTVG